MTVRGHACMRVCAFMNWFINYVTHTHTYIHLCVCVCLDALTLDKDFFYLSKALTHKKIDRLIDSRYIYR